jgi:hypothetical protein
MPLEKSSSKKAFKENVKEMESTHPLKQSLAAAFSMQRQMKKKAQKPKA